MPRQVPRATGFSPSHPRRRAASHQASLSGHTMAAQNNRSWLGPAGTGGCHHAKGSCPPASPWGTTRGRGLLHGCAEPPGSSACGRLEAGSLTWASSGLLVQGLAARQHLLPTQGWHSPCRQSRLRDGITAGKPRRAMKIHLPPENMSTNFREKGSVVQSTKIWHV